ncbi:MAG: hypothetical protein EAY81_05825 [Bacteroidetes bacterium]|nr:MAG: hypothetical protein EAY81_05825 [Bacteroidota bacterium]
MGMNKLITIATLVLFCINGFAQSKPPVLLRETFKKPILIPHLITMSSINPVLLTNGSFSLIMDANILINQQDLSKMKEEQLIRVGKWVTYLNKNILLGYGAYGAAGIYTFTSGELLSLPQRNINSIVGTVAGVVSVDGNTPNIKGARADGTAYFIDGVRVYTFSEHPIEPIATAVKFGLGF